MEEQVKNQKGSGANAPAVQQQKLSTHKAFDEQIIVKVNNYIKTKEAEGLVIPKDYSVTNALVAAKLHLMELKDKDGKLIIDQVTLPSVVNSLTKMVTSGYNIAKKHCAFIKYGDQLVCQPEYFGNLMVAKRDAEVKEVNGQCVSQGDEFTYEVDTTTGRMKLVKHVPKIENRNNAKIKGAYAIVVYNDGSTKFEVMTLDEIHNAWNMGASKGGSPAHKSFTDQMCKKTVENRAVKIDINTSDDSEIMDEEDQPRNPQTSLTEKANKKEISTEDIAYENVSETPESQKTVPEPAPLSDLGAEPKKDLPY